MKLKIQALGIAMVLFGSPIIHFFRDFAGILPKSALLMPAFSVIFFGMIFSLNHFKKIYKPNYNISVTAWCFLGYSMFMALVTEIPLKAPVEAFNYFFLALYFFLICGVNIKVSKVIIPIVVLVTLADNLALIVAFIRNPFTQIGQRAIISDVGWGEGAGNPSLYSFMAFTGLIASILIYNNAKLIWKLIAIATIFSSIAVILMTLIRATIFTLILCLLFYLFFNRKTFFKKNTKKWYEYGFEKTNLALFSLICLVGLTILLFIDKKLLANLLTYVDTSYRVVSHVIETLTAGNDKKAIVDASAANRLNTFGFAVSMLADEPLKIIYGYGYRYLYVDIPLMQILLEEGLIGFLLIMMFHYYVGKNVILAGQIANNKWILLLVYYYILLLMNSVSRGQPYDPYFWNYFLTIARFMKPEYMILKNATNKNEQVFGLSN